MGPTYTFSSQRIQWGPTLDPAASKELHRLFWVSLDENSKLSHPLGTGGRITDLFLFMLHMPVKIINSLWAELNANLFPNNIVNFTSVVNSGANKSHRFRNFAFHTLLCGPHRGSFAVQFGDHLRRCTLLLSS